jgi:hypothetical protein
MNVSRLRAIVLTFFEHKPIPGLFMETDTGPDVLRRGPESQTTKIRNISKTQNSKFADPPSWRC